MRSIVRFVLSHTVLVNLGFFFLMAVGVYAAFFSSVERYPNVNMAQVHITTVYPGASPAEVEALVTREIEDALDDMESVEFIRSTSYRDRSSVLVKLIDDSDYQRGYDEIRFRVLNILDELPPEVDPPLFNFIDVNDWQPVVTVNLVGERSNRALSLMAKELKISLLRIPGVKEVLLRGELEREFHVALDPLRLRRFGVTFAQVSEALKQANLAVPAGGLTAPGGEFLIRADERFRSRQQVMQTIVRTDQDGSHLRVSDLAGWAGLSYRDAFLYSSVNGNDCVRLDVIKTKQGNALTILEEVRALITDNRSLMQREGVEIVLTRDSTVRIKEAMRTLGMNLLVGVALVVLLIWYFMGFRNAAITTVGIPFSFLFTMVLMYVTGHSLNEITLFSFVLVSGIIVDDAIVVVENIYRHRQQGEHLVQA
ncbi:MAG: efflux RND transporter permease subunit, partial [Desulfarculaceae bacterium]